MLAFLLNPSVEALEKRRVPRWLAVGVMLLIMLGLLTAVGLTIPYLVKSEIERFSAQLPSYQGLIDRKVLPLFALLLCVAALVVAVGRQRKGFTTLAVVVTAVAGTLAVIWTLRTGHSGAESVWGS